VFAAMDVTLPIGRSRRLTVALTRRAGLRLAAWKREPPPAPPGEGPGGAAVREPRRPRPPRRGGAAALPLERPPGDER
jgi:hypothetical protein